MSQYRLTYFNFRGRAETSRMILAQAAVTYDDIRIELADWPALKPKTLTGQLPELEHGDFKLSQSIAIARYLANVHGLTGRDAQESANCDMLVDTMQEMLPELILIYKEPTEEGKVWLKKTFLEETADKFYGALEKALVSNNGGDGYLVGAELTWADIHVVNFLTWPSTVGVEVDMTRYPKLASLNTRVTALPNIAAWIKQRPVTSR